MTTEVDVPSGPLKGETEVVERVGGECNGGSHHQEKEGLVSNGKGKGEENGSHVFGVCGSVGDQVVADLRAENVVSSAEKCSVNGDGGVGVALELEGHNQGSRTEGSADEEQNGVVASDELAQGSVVDNVAEVLLVGDSRDQSETMVSKDQVQGGNTDAGSEGLLVEAALSNSSVARYENGAVVVADLGAENAVSSAEKDSVNEDDELKVEDRVTGDCNLETNEDRVALELEEPGQGSVTDSSATNEQNGAVDSQELAQLSSVGDESEELLVDVVVSAREQSETLVSKDQIQGSTAGAGSEGILDEAAVSSGSIARYQNGTEVEDDLRAENVVSLAEKDSVNGHNELKVENGVNGYCSSQGDGDGVALELEEPNQGSVTDSRSAGDQYGEMALKELAEEVVVDDESEELSVDAAVSDGSTAREQSETMVSKDQVQGSIVDAGSEGCLVEASVSNGSVARYQNGPVVSEDQEQDSLAVAESERLLVDAAVTDSGGARDQNGTVVSDDQVKGSIADAVHEGLLVDTAGTDTNVAREQNGTVIFEDKEQGSIDAAAAAEPEGCVVDTGDKSDSGLAEQVEDSKNQTVAVVESFATGGIGSGQVEVESCEDASDVTYRGSEDCKAPLLDTGELSNGEESNLELARKVPGDDVVVSKELLDNEKGCEIEESRESKITVQSHAEFEVCPLNGGVEVKENQESPVIVDLEQEKILGEVANKLIPEVVLESTEMNLEQIPKAVSSGKVQTEVEVENGDLKYDLPKRDCANIPDAEFINEAQGRLNPEAHVPSDDHSNLPEEASVKSFKDTEGQPAIAGAESYNIHVEANTEDVDTSKVDNNAEDGEAQLGGNSREFFEEGPKNTVVQINVEDGETPLVETTSEFVEEESKSTVFQITEGETNEEGDAQLVKTSELVEESIQDSKNGVVPQITKVETDVQHAEANSKSDTMESREHSYVSNDLADGEEDSESKLNVVAAEIETEAGEMSQPANADSESFCSSGPPVEKKPFYFMIKVPRFDESKFREEIALAQLKVVERTKIRDAIMAEIQPERIICRDLWKTFQDFVSEQKILQTVLKSKRQEIDSHQFLMNKVRDAMSMDDIDERIRNMKHMIEHESLPLKEEKQYVREMEKLKQTREDLSSNMGKQEEVQNTSEQKDQIQKQLKLLKKEVDPLREKYKRAQDLTTVARKKYDDQNAILQRLEADYRNANQCRQQEYSHLQSLRGALKEKNKHFWKYKDDTRVAYDYASSKDKEALQQHCVNQVESFMELWNKNDEFRKEYVNCNLRSTLRRLGTHDGRSLGPDEEPPIIPNPINWFNNKTSAIVSTPEEEKAKEVAAPPMESKKTENAKNNKVIVTKKQTEDAPTDKVIAMKKQIEDAPRDKVIETKKTGKLKPDPVVNNSTPISGKSMVGEEASEEVTKVVVVEDEVARKAEELRKEEEASRLEEQLRLEQKAKAKEALERKKRKAEKAQARAEFRAKKEQEERNRKMEKKKAAVVVGDSNETHEEDQQSCRETPVVTKEPEHQEKASTVTKRSSKPLRYTKSKPIPPPPLRNRGKRRMQTWMWFLVAALVVFALILLGSSDLLSKLGLHKFVY